MALGSLITGGLSAIGSGIAGLFGKKSQSSSNKANIALAEKQNEYNLQLQQNEFRQNQQQSELEYQRNLELWHLQQEYNTPSAQMQRYLDAGLNPNLIYGTGSASAGNAGSVPSYTAARYSAPRAERATVSPSTFDAHQMISVATQLALQSAQTDSIRAQADFTKQETQNKKIDNLIKAEQLTGFKTSNKYRDQQEFWKTLDYKEGANLKIRQGNLLDLNHSKLQYELSELQPLQKEKLAAEVLNLRVSADLKTFEYEMNKIGINTRDPLWSRLGVRLLTAGDSEFSTFLRNLFNRK